MSGETDDREISMLISDSNSLGLQSRNQFRRINTLWVIIILCIVMVALEVLIFVLPILHSSHISIILYSHSGVWFICLLADTYLRTRHQLWRSYGYHEFYRQTRYLRRFPLTACSGATAMLLVLIAILTQFCGGFPNHCPKEKLSDLNYMQIIVSLEVGGMLPALIYYLVLTVKFNNTASLPDVIQDDTMTAFIHTQAASTSDIGFRDGSFEGDVLEKQADMIKYLKQNNELLAKKVQQMSEQLNPGVS